MKLQKSRATLVTLVFVAVTLVALTSTLVEAMNYGSYWGARSALTASVDKLKIDTSPMNGTITIRSTVSATNPTDYYGMTVRYFELRLYFVKPSLNQTLFSGDASGDLIDLVSASNPPVGDAIGPHSTVSLVLTLRLSSSQSAAFAKFEQPSPSDVYGQTVLTAIVDSFLDRSTGPETVQNVQTVPIS